MDLFRTLHAFCSQRRENSVKNQLKVLRAQNHRILAILEITMPTALENLQAEVANNTTVQQSAITLLGNLKGLLDAAIAAGDMGAVQAVADSLGANDTALAAAVVANTPAAGGA